MKYEFSGRIRFSETDIEKKLTIGSLIDYFQDCSTFQSEDLGIGFDRLERQHAAWILSFWQIVIDRMPGLGEEVTTATWAYDFKDFYGLRNFTMTDAEGKMAAYANSVWVLFDLENGRPVRIDQDILDAYGTSPRLEMEYMPRKIKVPRGDTGISGSSEQGGQKPQPPLISHGEQIHVTRQHLDTNHHVNNGQYIQFASDNLPDGFEIRMVCAEFRGQARYGDTIYPEIYDMGPDEKDEQRILVLLSDNQGKPYTVVEFRGRER